MHHRVDALRERPLEHGGIGDVALNELHRRVGMGLEVDDADPGARPRELGHDLAADEARAAGDQHAVAAKIRPPRLRATRVAHFSVSARAVAGSSLEVDCQLTVGMIAARSTRSLWRSTTSNR